MKKFIFAAVAAGVLALFSGLASSAHAQVTSSDQVLFGITYIKNQIIKIDPTTGVGTLVMKIDQNERGYGLAAFNDSLYSFSPTTGTIDNLSKIDGRVLSSTALSVAGLAGEGDLVIGADGEGFLASVFDSKGAPTRPLYRFNVNTGVAVELKSTAFAIDGLALDNGTPQTLYALGQADAGTADSSTIDAKLYRVDQVTGTLSEIGPLNVPKNSPVAGMTFAPDGTLYGAIDDKLYKINTTTGAATIVDAATPDFSFSSVSGLAYATGASVLGNLSSRADVIGDGDDVLITGFIIASQDPASPAPDGTTKEIILRGLGPSLTVAGQPLAGRLLNPTLSLRDANGDEIAFNDDWQQNTIPVQNEIKARLLAPQDSRESVIVANLPAGTYTAILKGSANGNGIALEEIYDVQQGNGLNAVNLSARAAVAPGDDALISGMIVQGSEDKRVIIRGLGPSLAGDVSNPLPDPVLTAYDSDGTQIGMNDNWMNSPEAADIVSAGLAPSSPKEAVIDRIFVPGVYTVVLTGKEPDPSGVALIEVYDRD